MTFIPLDKNDYKKIMHSADSEINQNILMLCFLDFDFDPDLITKKLELEPLSTGQKGDEYFVGPQKNIAKFRECSHWDYEWKINSNDFISDLIGNFFNEIIIPRLGSIKEISLNCKTVRFIVVQYYYIGHNPGYGFEKERINILADINAEIDMDIYCLCEDK